MFLDIMIKLIMNGLVLLSMSVIYSMFPYSIKSKEITKKILFGLYIGVTGLALMSIPFDFGNGVFFDTRSILMSSAGIFFGGIPTIIGGFILGGYRLFQGGTGTLPGILEIIISASIGLGYRYYLKEKKGDKPYNIRQLLTVAFVTQILIFSLMFTLPLETRNEIMPKMWYIILFLYPLLSVLIYQFHIIQQANTKKDERIKQSEMQYRNLFEESHVALMLLDQNGKIVDANKNCLEFYGYTLSEMKSKYIQDINTLTPEEVKKEIKECLDRKKDTFNFKHRLANNTIRDVEVYSGPVMIDNQEYLLSTILDATDKVKDKKQVLKKQDELTYASNHDYLTGLYNRFFFEEELKRLTTKRQLPLSIILGDLNGLKKVNDTYSHLVGDELIKEITGILKTAIRSEDICARWGGDEFAILLPQTDKKTTEKICKRIEKLCLKSTFEPITPSISLGFDTQVVLQEDTYKSLKLAEKRMYKNKRQLKTLNPDNTQLR